MEFLKESSSPSEEEKTSSGWSYRIRGRSVRRNSPSSSSPSSAISASDDCDCDDNTASASSGKTGRATDTAVGVKPVAGTPRPDIGTPTFRIEGGKLRVPLWKRPPISRSEAVVVVVVVVARDGDCEFCCCKLGAWTPVPISDGCGADAVALSDDSW